MNPSSLEDAWRARYDRWAGQHQADHLIAGWSEHGLSRRLALVLQLFERAGIDRHGLVLDLGSGPGTYTRSITGLGYWCVGLDYSFNVAKIAKNRDLLGRYLQGEAYHLPFKNGSFDALLCVGVLQSLQSIDDAMSEVWRVLRPGGYLFLDGLNSYFWLHGVRSLKENAKGVAKRMSYYDPFSLSKKIEALGFGRPRIHWLVVPEALQDSCAGERASMSRILSLFFGHAFLIVARKQS